MSEAHGREEREASTCLLHKGDTLSPRAGVSSPVPLFLRSNVSIPFKEKEGGKHKDEDGSPVHLCNFFGLTHSTRKEQTTRGKQQTFD